MRRIIIAIVVLGTICGDAGAWGRRGHRAVHHIYMDQLAAVDEPASGALLLFLNQNRLLFIHEADLADRSRNVSRDEAPNHYFDSEDFGGARIYDSFPEVRPADVPDSAGRLPWAAADQAVALRRAIRERDYPAAMRALLYLGHFVADAHVPLHSTRYFDGRNSDEKGIHGRWESKTLNSMVDVERAVGVVRRYSFIEPAASDSDLHSAVAYRVAQALRGSFELVDKVYAADERSRALDPAIKDTYFAEMRRLQEGLIRDRISESAGMLEDIVRAAAGAGLTESLSINDELRLDEIDVSVDRREYEGIAEFTLSVFRLSDPANVKRQYRIEFRGMTDRNNSNKFASFDIYPPDRAGDSVALTFPIPVASLVPYGKLEIRLLPLDVVTPEDNVVLINSSRFRRTGK